MQMGKRKDKWNDLFELAMYVTAAVCIVYFLVKGNQAKMLQAVLIVAVLLIIRIVVKVTKTTMFAALRFSVLLFIFVTMFMANEFGFYKVIPYLDKIEHLFSGLILCFVGLLIYMKASNGEKKAVPSAQVAVWFCLFFSIAMAGVWEIYEFTTDGLFGLHSQNGSLVDTMTDIICGTIGAVLTSIYLAFKAKRRKMPLIDVQS
ncbi:putative membrane protein YjdF [Paenibacillus sp. V4I3]|uniref:hypothetical protein n=1 Tax=unclassified Paenibacillus TaxID=185978 RepID=UPI00278B6115|nr:MULTISPECIES: hypothetical protein [unclassified Paenibacillus]MDQ0874690.1 putative membrane protein YjdF [Paenibacillus sp. V4I3]MDQ0889559.1 putative membrane protein YjdF [Paenibacillus sp. V4I9]